MPAILTAIIDDPKESMLIRRQAIKALALYPTDESFTFITARLEGAPLGLQRLYITSLAGFGHSRRQDILPLLEALLANRDATVRDAALGLAQHLAPGPALRGLLQARLAVEPEAGLRQAIQRQLQGQ